MTARATLAALAMLLGACCLPGEYCGDLEISIVNETTEAVVIFGEMCGAHEEPAAECYCDKKRRIKLI